MKALGLFEVQGLVQAIIGADTALKAANVELENIEKVKGGLVSVVLCGDVGAIEAAISAVKHEVPAELLRSSHVIARPSKDIHTMYEEEKVIEKPAVEEKIEVENKEVKKVDKVDNKKSKATQKK